MRVDPNFFSNILVPAIDRSSAREDALASEISSGSRLAFLSDDPIAAAQSSMLNSAISRDDTFLHNASREQSLLQVTDTALGEVVTQVTSAIALGVKGQNATYSPANRAALAQELAGVRDQVLALANSSYLGTYVFAGSKSSSRPFSLDQTVTPAVATYLGDSSVQSIQTPKGQDIPLNLPGAAIFLAPGASLLAALNNLIADLSSGVPGPGSAAETAALSTALGVVSQQRSLVGTALSSLESTSSSAQTEQAQLKARQAYLVAADTAQVATDLRTAETQHQALLSVMNVLSKGSLFDYMR